MENRRVVIFGATGATGRHVVEMALGRGHEVTAFVREAAKLPEEIRHVRIVEGDVTLNDGAVQDAVRGQEVVVSALGCGRSFKPDGLIEKAARAIVGAMTTEGVRRLIFTSAFGLGDTRSGHPLLPRLMRATLLKKVYADKEVGEEIIRQSALDWTFVHPSGLTNGPVTGTYRAGPSLRLRGFPTISRADVAHCLLAQVDDDAFTRKTVLISS